MTSILSPSHSMKLCYFQLLRPFTLRDATTLSCLPFKTDKRQSEKLAQLAAQVFTSLDDFQAVMESKGLVKSRVS